MTALESIQTAVARAAGRRDKIAHDLAATVDMHKEAGERLATLMEAQAVIQKVAVMTQKTLEYRVSELATLALAAVFPEPYGLSLAFEQQRGRSEAVITFTRDGEHIPPMTAAGCGAVDVASLALRVSLLRLTRPMPRPTIVLDEPLRYLSSDLMGKAAEMLKRISTKLGIQFIIVTHEEELAEAADRVFRVSLKNGRSRVVQE